MFFDDPQQIPSSLLHQIITGEEFEKLLLACAVPNEEEKCDEQAAAQHRAILWLFYDTGIRVSELINLRLGDVDRHQGMITIHGQGARQRRIALGQNCLRNLLYYLDRHRPDEQELEEWGRLGEDHVLLSETGQPMTKNDITLLLQQLKKRAAITGKRISPRVFRRTFAIRYLELSHDPISLQRLLGYEDMALINCCLPMSKATIGSVQSRASLNHHIPDTSSQPRAARRRGFQCKE